MSNTTVMISCIEINLLHRYEPFLIWWLLLYFFLQILLVDYDAWAAFLSWIFDINCSEAKASIFPRHSVPIMSLSCLV